MKQMQSLISASKMSLPSWRNKLSDFIIFTSVCAVVFEQSTNVNIIHLVVRSEKLNSQFNALYYIKSINSYKVMHLHLSLI
jgi:hypothetical protein